MAIISSSGTWSVGSNWPWPRVLNTKYYLLAVAIARTKLNLYELYKSGDDYNAIKVTELGALSDITSVSVAEFERHYVISAFGYSSTDLWTNLIGRWARASVGEEATVKVEQSQIPHGTALCNFKGQLLIGGIKSDDLKWSELGPCAVVYGGIGNVEFDPLNDKTAGFVKMPWDRNHKGKVYHVMQLGDDVIVYGDKGIEKLTPFSTEVITGFGQKTLQLGGILGFNCAAGNEYQHCFINNKYELCS